MRGAQQIIRVALFAATVTLITALETSTSDPRIFLKCKNIAREVMMNSCKGPRTKRSLDLNDMEKRLPFDASESPHDEQHATQQKRQWGSGWLPGMDSELQNTYHNTEFHTPLLDFEDNRGSEMIQEQYGNFGAGNFFPMPYAPPGLYPRSSSSNKLLGYQLTPEELEELHIEMGERMPRNSKDFNKIFLNIAEKCCSNPKVCYDNPSIVACGRF